MNFVVIGLGNFGASLAKKLSSMGHEVIGVDRDLSKVEFYKDRISHTICLDATDIHAIRSLPVADADMVIVAIGHDFSSSVMITALLKKMNVPHIVGRETSSIHITVMKALGIDNTVNPEFEAAMVFAEKLVMEGAEDIFPLSREIKIAEVILPSFMAGKPINMLKIKEDYTLDVLALKRYPSEPSAGGEEYCKVFTFGHINDKLIPESADHLIIMGNKDDILDFINGR